MSQGDTSQQSAIHAATAHMQAGRLGEAEKTCRNVLMLAPNQVQALQILGSIALQRGQADNAVEHFQRAAALAPKLVQAHSNLGAALLAAGRVEQAVSVLKKAIRTDPAYGHSYINLGDALMKLSRFAEATSTLRRAVTLVPFDAKGHTNLGAALTRLMQYDEAVVVLRKAVELNPKLAQAHFNLGGAYNGLGLWDPAVACFEKAVALQPGYQDADFHRALVLLTQGRFADGWRSYMSRPSVRDVKLPLHREPLARDLTGTRILLGRDQGLGDEIFFLRFAPELKRRGAYVIYQGGGKILSMLGRLACLDEVVDEETPPPLPGLIVSLGDLPCLLGAHSLENTPPSLTLPVLPDRVEAQRAALAAAGPPPYIGVTWRAGLDQAGSLFKNAPLERIAGVLQKSRGTLIALQRLPEKGELGRLAKTAGRPVHDFTALNDQLEDMLALLSLLDDYVTVSNTNVHLRAMVGRSSRVLVPHPPEFRWTITGSVSPWFPDSPVYRQDAARSWDAALAALEADLAAQ